ncbi:MAG: hypothetical protein LAO30_04455 [Acidobacteriia bacterium]|nr:hypothetical protein [Terriglobia bacterium]
MCCSSPTICMRDLPASSRTQHTSRLRKLREWLRRWTLAGIHTQPAALAFANAHTGSERTNVSYAAVYPVALIAKIILAQLLVLL